MAPMRASRDRLLEVIAIQNEIASSPLELDEVMARVAACAQDLTSAVAAVVELAEGDQMVYRAATGSAASHVGLRLQAEGSLSGLCVREGEVLNCIDSEEDPRVDREACRRVGARSMLCVPLQHGDDTVGVLKVMAPRAQAFDAEDARLLEMLSGVVAAHLGHAQKHEEVLEQSLSDPLTGLGNRRAYDQHLAVESARVDRYGQDLSLVLLDLDRFKQVNDTFGHPRGDEVLAEVGRLLIEVVRRPDLAFRLGGDEFALVLPETPLVHAGAVAGRLSGAVERSRVIAGEVTVSAGVAQAVTRDPLRLHEAADAALYEAKERRGSVALAGVR